MLWADQSKKNAYEWVELSKFNHCFPYFHVNAWIGSSRATRIPYHARVLRRLSVLWGNHSMPFPPSHGGSKKA